MSGAPKHHYIPVFYLKQWAHETTRQLYVFSKPHGVVKSYEKYPDGAGYIRGLYTFSGLPAAAANYLENVFFLHADDKAARIHQRLLRDDVEFDGPAKTAWSRFIMTLLHRNPESMERITKTIAVDFPAAVERYRATYDTMRHESDPATFEEFKSRMSGEALERTMIVTLQRVMDSELLGTAFNSMIWGVMRIRKSRYPLLTSDRPIVMTNGLSKPDAHIVMPISPDRIFVAAKNKETMRQIDLDGQRGKLAENLNDRVVRQARQFVFSTTDAQHRFIAKRLGERAKWSPWE